MPHQFQMAFAIFLVACVITVTAAAVTTIINQPTAKVEIHKGRIG